MTKAAPMAEDGSGNMPAHQRVYRDIRARVLFGDLAPGQAVTIQGLADAAQAGMTPVREAIRRLTSEGALVFQGNRRVSVPILAQSDLEDIVFVRKTVECELLRRAVDRMTPDKIAALADIDARLDRAIDHGDVAGYLRCNHAFHTQLYQIADAPVLAELTDRLWLRFGPSLRVVCGRFGTQNLPDRHKDILQALRAGDAVAATRALSGAIAQGIQHHIAALHDNGDSIDSP